MNVIDNGIKFTETNDYKELSEISARIMLNCVKEKPDMLLCIATGTSPTLAYDIFVQTILKEKIDVTKLRIIKLDEWWKVDMNDRATCEYYVQEKIIKPLNISNENYICFNSNASDADMECKRIAKLAKEAGPIDLCILGMGKNGHLGLNEPDTCLLPFSHTVKLTEKTKTHTMLTKTSVPINYGMTLGISNIISSKMILFLATGEDKNVSFHKFMSGKVCTDLPASILWLHPDTSCVYEKKLTE